MKELFVPSFVQFLCNFCVKKRFLHEKCFFQFKKKFFRVDPNYIKKMQTNWESFIIVREKIFQVEIRFFLVTCLFVLLRCLLQFHFVNYYWCGLWKRWLETLFFKRFLLKGVYLGPQLGFNNLEKSNVNTSTFFKPSIFFLSPFIFSIIIEISARYLVNFMLRRNKFQFTF